MRSILALCLAFGVALAATSAAAQKRVALIIGNDAYTNVTPLRKATSDARAYRQHFETERGFDQVFYAEDADEETMVETIAGFISSIDEGDVAVVVYSGHGVQLDQNRSDSLFLLPTDIPALDGSGLSAEFRLSRSAISFSELRTQISLRGASTRVFVLDACRDNPFASADGTRSVGHTRGLAPIKTVSGEFVFFAAAPGARALDRLSDTDENPNSVFSRIFLQHFRKGAFLEDIANDVQQDVFELAKTAEPSFIQQPYYDDGVIGRTCIDDACGQAATGPTGPSATGPTVAAAQCDRALARELWDFARETNDCLGYDAFLEACPQSTFAAFARAGRARLGCDAVATAAPSTDAPARPAARPSAAAPSGRSDDGVAIAAAPAPVEESRNEAAALEAPADDTLPQQQQYAPKPSKYEARRQVLSALSELYKAGVETQYDALRIEETSEGVEARLENLRARFPDLDVEISLQEIAARRDEAGGIIFTLPERIVLEDLTPVEGAPETAEMIISSEALFAGLYQDEEGGHVLRIGAAKLKLEPPEQDGESIAFSDLAVDGRLAANADTGDASLAAAVSVSEATAELKDGGDLVKMRAQGLLFRFDGDRDQAKGVFGVKSAGISGPDFGNVGLGGLQFSLDAQPGDQFDFSAALAPEATTEDVIGAVVATVYQKVLEGGHIDTSAALAQLSGKVGPGGADSADAVSFDSRGLGAKLELNPYRIGTSIQAKAFSFDGATPEPVSFSFDNMRADFAAEPGNRFDWSGVAAAPGDQEASWAMIDQIRQEVAAGGRASLILTNDGYRTLTPMPEGAGIGPFTALGTGSASNITEITFEQDIARLAMNATSFYYEAIGETSGRADVGGFNVDAAFPLTASPKRQEGRASLDLNEIVLDDSLWAQIDPKNVLNHKIGGISLKTIILTTIVKDLLTLDGSEVDAPLTVHAVNLTDLSVDALGARLSAVGDLIIDPTPVGVVTATVNGWRQMFTGLGQTPMATDPDAAGMLLMATNWLETYGVEGANADETILKIEFSETGQVIINGKPFEG